jgi:trehalose 6-phosphate synthase
MLVAAIFAISPFASTFVEQWSRRDVELRSALVFNSVRDELANLLAAGATAQINNLFGRLALDERLLAVGFCGCRPRCCRNLFSPISGTLKLSDQAATSTI